MCPGICLVRAAVRLMYFGAQVLVANRLFPGDVKETDVKENASEVT